MKKPIIKMLCSLGSLTLWHQLILMVLLGLVGILIMNYTYGHTKDSVEWLIFNEIGKAIFITSLVTGLTNFILTFQYKNLIKTGEDIYKKEHEEKLKETLEAIKKGIMAQTKIVADYAYSLDSMQKSDIIKVFTNRLVAASEISEDIQNPNITFLNLIGVSFNDFLRPGHSEFHEAWRIIESYIKGEKPFKGKLHIRILLIDPRSYGAYHRSKAEERHHVGIIHRLEGEVTDSIAFLCNLLYEIPKGEKRPSNIKLEVRLYQTVPLLYLVQSDTVSYVQHYYFWQQHGNDVNSPVLKYQAKHPSAPQFRPMHKEMEAHFEYIWNKGSIDIEGYYYKYNYGYFDAIHDANITNIFYDRDICKARIIHLLDTSKEIIYIKGITLKSYFIDNDLSTALKRAIYRKLKDSDGNDVKGPDGKDRYVTVRILVINRDGIQAKYRSFREYKLRHPDANFEQFSKNDDERKEQILYRDCTGSIEAIERMFDEMKNDNIPHDLKASQYDSAPESFMLLTDESVLVEQYHYGKVVISKKMADNILRDQILGGDFPIIEVKKREQDNISSKDIYKIFKDHFEFVFKHFSKEI